MADDAQRVVWILGAGFSRALGAPLLADLFTPKSLREIEQRYQFARSNERTAHLVQVCQAGTYGLPHSRPVGREWRHAEEFLEVVERAIADETARRCLRQFAEQALAHTSRSNALFGDRDHTAASLTLLQELLAAECSAFHYSFARDNERALPYSTWVSALKPTDTVITFNYDRLVERWGLRCILPDQEPIPLHPVVLKLHGSVGWCFSENGRGVREVADAPTDDARWGDLPTADNRAIATPGPRKRSLCEEGGAFHPLWARARAAIINADVLVFVGYCNPPTDAYTRDRLFSWIWGNVRSNAAQSHSREPLRAHIVLGPDVAHSDSVRLQGLLDACQPGGDATGIAVRAWPMWAEDFLALVSRDRLLSGG